MKLKYDIETDILYIKFSDKVIVDSDEDKPGVILDFSEDGTLVGIEILNASKSIDNLNKVDISGAVGDYSFAMAA
jgi:uncharacterized protein YuzE